LHTWPPITAISHPDRSPFLGRSTLR